MKKIFKKSNNKSGFTLIELMVATSIFTVIMLAAMGSLVITSNLAKKSQALNFTMDNLSFAIESMSRSLRMGTNYHCQQDGSISTNNPLSGIVCPQGAGAISFIPAKGSSADFVIYFRSLRNDGTGTIGRYNSVGNEYSDLISENIDIQELKFFLKGVQPNDNIQPSLYIKIRGVVNIKGEQIGFAVQTMISQRTLE